MAVNFPKNPTVGLTWLDPSNSVSYTWDGYKWSSIGTGVSFTTVIFSIGNDDSDLNGASATTAINAALVANGKINNVGELRPGNTVLIIDSGNPDHNVNVSTGQYLFDGLTWVRVPSIGAQVISIFGRIGSISAQEGDYSLNQLGDVDLSTPARSPTTNSLLRFDGTKYVPGEARNTPSVNAPLTKTGSDVTPTLGFSLDSLSPLPE